MADGSEGLAEADDSGADTPGAGTLARHLALGPGLDSSPPVSGTEIRLTLKGTEFTAFDGCNTLRGGSGRTEELIARPDGTFGISGEFVRMAIGCDIPPGVLEQAERYALALTTGGGYKMVEGGLEIADYQGVVTLVFLKRG